MLYAYECVVNQQQIYKDNKKYTEKNISTHSILVLKV